MDYVTYEQTYRWTMLGMNRQTDYVSKQYILLSEARYVFRLIQKAIIKHRFKVRTAWLLSHF